MSWGWKRYSFEGKLGLYYKKKKANITYVNHGASIIEVKQELELESKVYSSDQNESLVYTLARLFSVKFGMVCGEGKATVVLGTNGSLWLSYWASAAAAAFFFAAVCNNISIIVFFVCVSMKRMFMGWKSDSSKVLYSSLLFTNLLTSPWHMILPSRWSRDDKEIEVILLDLRWTYYW